MIYVALAILSLVTIGVGVWQFHENTTIHGSKAKAWMAAMAASGIYLAVFVEYFLNG